MNAKIQVTDKDSFEQSEHLLRKRSSVAVEQAAIVDVRAALARAANRPPKELNPKTKSETIRLKSTNKNTPSLIRPHSALTQACAGTVHPSTKFVI